MASEITGWLKKIWQQNSGSVPGGSVFNDNTQTTQVVNAAGDQILTNGSQKTQLVDSLGTIIPPAGDVAKLTATLTRPADVLNYTAGDAINSSVATPVVLTLANAAIGLGGGGFIMDAKMETDAIQFTGATLRFWIFTQEPSNIVGDNVPYVNSFINSDKRGACAYFDMVFDPLLAGSDCIIGKYQPNTEYVCDVASTSIYILVQTLTGITAPKSAGMFKFSFNVVKLQ